MIHRLLLLSMSAGLFAVVWAGDRPARVARSSAAGPARVRAIEVAGPVRRAAIPVRRAAGVGLPSPRMSRPVPDDPVEAPVPLVVRDLASGRVLILGGEIPLPRGLTAGAYHVVSSRGDAHRVLVPATVGTPCQTAGAGSYVESRGTVRWHFIRIDTPSMAANTGDETGTPAADEGDVLAWSVETARRLRAAVAGRLAEIVARLSASLRRGAEAVVGRLRRLPDTGARWAGAMGESLDSSLRRIGSARRVAVEPSRERRL